MSKFHTMQTKKQTQTQTKKGGKNMRHRLAHILDVVADDIRSRYQVPVNAKELEWVLRDYLARKIRKEFIADWDERIKSGKIRVGKNRYEQDE